MYNKNKIYFIFDYMSHFEKKKPIRTILHMAKKKLKIQIFQYFVQYPFAFMHARIRLGIDSYNLVM